MYTTSSHEQVRSRNRNGDCVSFIRLTLASLALQVTGRLCVSCDDVKRSIFHVSRRRDVHAWAEFLIFNNIVMDLDGRRTDQSIKIWGRNFVGKNSDHQNLCSSTVQYCCTVLSLYSSSLITIITVEISPRAQCHNDMTGGVIRYIASDSEHIDYIQG
jgi:hypothetical protein